MGKRNRRVFTNEYKAEAVRLARDSGKSIGATAKTIGVSETALRRWRDQAEIDEGKGPAGALTTDERLEMRRLRRELSEVKMERDFLKKAAAFFAKEIT